MFNGAKTTDEVRHPYSNTLNIIPSSNHVRVKCIVKPSFRHIVRPCQVSGLTTISCSDRCPAVVKLGHSQVTMTDDKFSQESISHN